jgi:hypothetical protein
LGEIFLLVEHENKMMKGKQGVIAEIKVSGDIKIANKIIILENNNLLLLCKLIKDDVEESKLFNFLNSK